MQQRRCSRTPWATRWASLVVLRSRERGQLPLSRSSNAIWRFGPWRLLSWHRHRRRSRALKLTTLPTHRCSTWRMPRSSVGPSGFGRSPSVPVPTLTLIGVPARTGSFRTRRRLDFSCWFSPLVLPRPWRIIFAVSRSSSAGHSGGDRLLSALRRQDP